jgi:transcription antitermination factor NusG
VIARLAAEKTELWDRWKRGESLKAIGRALGKQSSSIYFLVAPHGGIRPAERRRSKLAFAFPRYIFVPVEQAWSAFHELWRVLGVVAFGDELAVVPQCEIDRLRKLGGGSDLLPVPAKPEPFKTGAHVHVGGYGPLSGHDAVYQEIATEGRLRLLFDWMGRMVPIDVDQRDVCAELRNNDKKRRRSKRRKHRS